MICARAEAWALVLKAGRGAGVPTGQAEDLAHAMMHAPVPAWAEIQSALTDPLETQLPQDGEQLVFASTRVVMDGPSAIDAALLGSEVYLGAPDAPLILLMMCQNAERATTKRFEYLFDDEGGVLLRLSGETAQAEETAIGHIEIPDQVWGFLNILAAKTYVPESAASRASGAGAGLLDND